MGTRLFSVRAERELANTHPALLRVGEVLPGGRDDLFRLVQEWSRRFLAVLELHKQLPVRECRASWNASGERAWMLRRVFNVPVNVDRMSAVRLGSAEELDLDLSELLDLAQELTALALRSQGLERFALVAEQALSELDAWIPLFVLARRYCCASAVQLPRIHQFLLAQWQEHVA